MIIKFMTPGSVVRFHRPMPNPNISRNLVVAIPKTLGYVFTYIPSDLYIFTYSFYFKIDMSYHLFMSADTNKHVRQKPLRLKGLPEDLRKTLREARTHQGWGQRELGSKIGLPQPHISAIESGRVVPRFDTLIDIVRVLELDLVPVPRSLVPAVQSLIRAQKEPESVEKPMYAANDEERGPERRDHDEL